MWRLAWGALWARRAQSAALLLLTVLVAAAAAAVPWYLDSALDDVAASSVRTAPVKQRVISVTREARLAGGLTTYETDLANGLKLPGFDSYLGVYVSGEAYSGARRRTVPMAYRAGLCERLVIDGACPHGPGQALLSRPTAAALGARRGDRVTFRSGAIVDPPVLTVVGIYQPRDVADPYWAALPVLGPAAGGGTADAVVVDRAVFTRPGINLVTVSRTLLATPAGLGRGDLDRVVATVSSARQLYYANGYILDGDLSDLADRIQSQQNLLRLAVPLSALLLALLGWFALFLAVGETAKPRRADVGLLRLRGVPTGRVWALISPQSALPVLVAIPFGIAAGYLLAAGLTGAFFDPLRHRTTSTLAVALSVAAVLGALLAALASERRTLRTPVATLLRQVPRPRPAWQSGAVDAAVVALALAGIYQVRSTPTAPASGFAVLAPALLAVAVGVLGARLLAPVAARVTRRMLRTGHLSAALAGVHVARRPGVPRLVTLFVVASAALGYAALAWVDTDHSLAWRAERDLGGDRVLTVRADSRAALLAAVRAADPSGRYAMAVSRIGDAGTAAPVLAVDSGRLAAVAPGFLPAGHEGDARRLRPARPEPVRVTGTAVDVSVTVSRLPRLPVRLVVDLTGPDGRPAPIELGPLRAGSAHYGGPVDCRAGCRLVGFELAGGPPGGPPQYPPAGLTVRLDGLSQSGPAATVLGAAVFGDRTRWWTTGNDGQWGPELSTVAAGAAGLTMSLPGRALADRVVPDGHVYLGAAPVPVPVLAAGEPAGADDPRINPFGTGILPGQVVSTVGDVPRIGHGYVVDLEYAALHSPDVDGVDVTEVWLASGAPATLTDALSRRGVAVVGTDSMATARARYAGSGPAALVRYQLLAALMAQVLVAAALLLAAAVERPDRVREYAVLRAQGLPARTARRAGLWSYAPLCLVAVLIGLLAAAAARALVGTGPPAVYAPPGGAATTLAGLALWAGGLLATVAVAVALAVTLLGRAVGRTLGAPR